MYRWRTRNGGFGRGFMIYWMIALWALWGEALESAQRNFCEEAKEVFKRNRWGTFDCPKAQAKIYGLSVLQRPLLYFEAGNPKAEKMTLVQCGIHGDELPSFAMCMKFIKELEDNKRPLPEGMRVVVQPLLNPDGIFRQDPQRQNARGIDINRNFPTRDWKEHALASWSEKDGNSPRKFPGTQPNSEPETQALVRFISEHQPQKIISVHTPLGFLDLDAKGDKVQTRRAKFLAINMSKNLGNYRFVRWGFYPGSLGNFAGREKEIPVYTLELPEGSSRPTVDQYWTRFRVALWRAIDFDLATGAFVGQESTH